LYISQIINKQCAVMHICNPSYSRAREWRVEFINPTWAKLGKWYLTINIKIKGMEADFQC
jgi:hypothetical protein